MAKNEVATLMAEDANRPASPDRLEKLRVAVRELRDTEQERADLAARSAELGTKLHELRTKTIVDLFDQAKVTSIKLPAEGNNPEYEVGVGWHYHANIGSPSDPKVEDYAATVAYIKKTDPDLLKTTYEVSFGLGESKKMKEFEAAMKKMKIDYSSSFGVPWNTLTAWVKAQYESKKTLPLKLLNATVERTAKVVNKRKSTSVPKSTAKKGK
jgi:hypothetical protein